MGVYGMNIKPNPFDLHTVTPYLVIPDVTRLIGFLKTVFDATTRGEPHLDGKRISHAEVRIGDSVIMMGEPLDQSDVRPATLHVYVDDCDQRMKKAIEAGASVLREPGDMPHGDRIGGVKDFAGNQWWMVEHIGKQSAQTIP